MAVINQLLIFKPESRSIKPDHLRFRDDVFRYRTNKKRINDSLIQAQPDSIPGCILATRRALGNLEELPDNAVKFTVEGAIEFA